MRFDAVLTSIKSGIAPIIGPYREHVKILTLDENVNLLTFWPDSNKLQQGQRTDSPKIYILSATINLFAHDLDMKNRRKSVSTSVETW